jgi:PAS domain S-box-containing protein
VSDALPLSPAQRNLRVAGVFLAGAALSFGGFFLTRILLQREVRADFEAASRERARSLSLGMEQRLQDVDTLRAFFEASDEVTRKDFDDFTGPLLARHSAIQALQWLPAVQDKNRNQLETEARRTHPDFRFFRMAAEGAFVEIPRGTAFYAVHFVAPYVGNEGTLGYSTSHLPSHQRALEEALRTGALTATGGVTLLQDPKAASGILVLAPVRRKGGLVLGLVQGVYRTSELVRASLQSLEPRGLEVGLYDVTAPGIAALLHAEPSPLPVRGPRALAGLRLEQRFDLAGRHWMVRVEPAGGYYDLGTPWQAWATLALGLAFSTLLAAYVRTLLVRQEAIAEQVRLRTLELSLETEGHRRAALALRESETRFHQLVEVMDEGMWVLDPAGCTTFVNPRMAALLGYPQEALIGHPIFEFMAAEDVPMAQRNMAERRDGLAAQHDFRFLRKDGSELWAIVSGTPVLDGEGRVVSVLGMITDITQRRQEERGQMESQKLESLGVLAGGIAHDFNNLLTAILGNVNLAQLVLPKLSPALPYLENMERTVQRATNLTRQMLAYSGKGRFVVEPLDLNHAVEEISHLLAVSISKKVALRYQLEPDLPLLMAEASQIQQVVMNLVTNASEAIGDEEGIVCIRTGTRTYEEADLRRDFPAQPVLPGHFVTLEVSDTGKGMSPEVMARIFEPFFTTKFTGRGLGLSAMQGIVRGHKGGIRVYSEEGKGTTFKLILPAGELGLQDSVPAHTAEAPQSHGTILVVDDEASVREVATGLLQSMGFEVLTATDGREALEVFQRSAGTIQAVLLDLTMPHLDGVETFRELRRLDPQCRVVLTSGYNEQEAIQDFQGKGLVAFVQKPFQRTVLQAAMEKALQR